MNTRRITFDVMLDERFVCTMRYNVSSSESIDVRSLSDFVVSRMPSLKGKPFQVRFNNVETMKGERQ